MKLILAIVHRDDSTRLTEELTKNKINVTKLASTGGFLRAGNVTFLIGTDEEHIEEVLEIIRSICKSRKELTAPAGMYMGAAAWPIEVMVGGATVFVMDVDRFEKI
ncbi:MAG: cyclic-di-AMP receptor [Eubacteriales bacterium]|nr:cyclic-di-AMP receptor [Eubacteriales bacterium]